MSILGHHIRADMKILILVGGFEPFDIGGVPRALRDEIQGLVDMGHQITVLARKMTTSSLDYEQHDGYEVFRFWAPSARSPLYYAHPILTLVALPYILKRLFRSRVFDVVYAHGPFEVLGMLHTQYPAKIVYCFHSPIAQEVAGEVRKGKYGILTPLFTATIPLLRRVERRALLGVDMVLVRSQFMKRQIAFTHGISETLKPIAVVPLPVDIERFKPGNQREARTRLGLPQGKPLLLTIRRLVARMGLENLIAAMAIVARKFPDCLLLIGGDGYLKRALQDRIRSLGLQQSVRLLGYISEEDLPYYYQAADLFVLPTTELEGFGMATVEALSSGTPVIGTPIGATPEILTGIGDGFLTRDTSADALAERIIWWLDNGISHELRLYCREYVVTHFNRARVLSALAQVLAPEQSTTSLFQSR